MSTSTSFSRDAVIDLTQDEPHGAAGSIVPKPARLRVVLLCGIIGSGKTTLSRAWCSLKPGWARVCQDELGDRAACENMCRLYLAQGLSCIIDRQNFDKQQRSTWIQIGRSFQAEVIALELNTPYPECRRRLQHRVGHETLPSPDRALQVLPQVARQFRPPHDVEGFDRIVRVPRNLPLRISEDDIDRILALLDSAPQQRTLDSLFQPTRTFPPAPVRAWGSASQPFA